MLDQVGVDWSVGGDWEGSFEDDVRITKSHGSLVEWAGEDRSSKEGWKRHGLVRG